MEVNIQKKDLTLKGTDNRLYNLTIMKENDEIIFKSNIINNIWDTQYLLNVNLKDFYSISKTFREYKSINNIYSQFFNNINKEKIGISSNDNKIIVYFIVNDNIKVPFILESNEIKIENIIRKICDKMEDIDKLKTELDNQKMENINLKNELMKRRNDDEKNILEIKKEIENLKKSINSIGLKNSYDNKLLEEKVKEITQMKIFENKNKNKKNSENEYKEIIDKVKDLYKIETKIENLIKMSIKNISKSDTYYLVNKKWMKEFKSFYDYDNIIKNNGKINKLFINQRFPDKLNNIDYLNVELDKKICNDAYVPINFEIFDKKNFDLIIKEINDKNKIKLEIKYYFNIYLGDNKIFIQDNNNKFLYFIYSLNNKEYTLEYIIKFNQNDNIKNFISKCEPNEKFEV